jgi:hypothetical protein
MTKTDYDPDRSLVLIEGLPHFLTNFKLALRRLSVAIENTKLTTAITIIQI